MVDKPRRQKEATMKNIQIVTSVLFLFFVGTKLVHAQGAGIEWQVLNQETMQLFQQGKYDRAIVLGREALELAEENVGPDHPDVAASLNNLAELYRTQGDYAK